MQKRGRPSIYITILAFLLVIFLVGSLDGPVSEKVIDTHEHIESMERAEVLFAANAVTGVEKTILIPSPTETLTLNGKKTFTGYKENVDKILEIAEAQPEHFIPFCTLSPMDPNALEYFQSCVERGGKGLKLYNGHSYYYDIFDMPLDSSRMLPIYAFAERKKIPLLFHINITKYQGELEVILDSYPDLVVSIPHFMVSSIGLEKVEALLDKYPNLYTDISFGSPEFMAAGFRRISNDPGKYADFADKYQDRLLFGADMVLTDAEKKDQSFMEETINCYKDLLQERRFACSPVTNYYEEVLIAHEQRYDQCEPKEGDYCENLKKKVAVYKKRFNEVLKLNGLGLSSSTLKKIHWENPKRFLGANQS